MLSICFHFRILPAICLGSQNTSCLSSCVSVPPGLVLPAGASGEEPTCQCRRHKRGGFDPWVRKISWRREWLPILALLPGESHGQRSLADDSPWLTQRWVWWSDLACTYSLYLAFLFCSSNLQSTSGLLPRACPETRSIISLCFSSTFTNSSTLIGLPWKLER